MDWFRDLTGMAEAAPDRVRARLRIEPHSEGVAILRPDGRRMEAGLLSCPSLGELRAATPGLAGPGRLSEVVADVRALHCDPVHAGAVFQVASQFNLLEMAAPDLRPEDGITRYQSDLTQGPACAIACGAGTLWRNYLVPLAGGMGQTGGAQLDMAADLGIALGNGGEGALWDMRNGYLLPHPGSLARISGHLDELDETGRDALRSLLRIGIQEGTEVTLGRSGHRVHQLYCSALPVAYGAGRAADWEPFARLVLEAAYEATLRAAARLAPGRPVFLTLLGGGAFGNHPDWIWEALSRAVGLCGGALDLRLVSHGRSNPELARRFG